MDLDLGPELRQEPNRLAALPWRSLGIGLAVVLVGVGGWLALRSDQRAAAVVLPRAAPAPPLVAPPAPRSTLPAAGPAGVAAGVAVGNSTAGTANHVAVDPAATALPDISFLVHAAGAVLRPGVYRFGVPVRVLDLLEAAGGPAIDADLSRVNLAAPLADGVRVYFPFFDEDPPPEDTVIDVPPVAVPATGDPATPAAPLNINTATTAQLEGLPGIGPVTAAAVVEYRDRAGPFLTVESLEDVSGIGPAKLERIRDLVTVTR